MTVNPYSRYQTGLTLADVFPSQNKHCSCGCGNLLPKNRKRWFSDYCRNSAFIKFAILKGDTTIIRVQLFDIDMGACRSCGCITDNWQADHIIPVIFGGSGCDLKNLQTLCLDCHKEKTVKQQRYYPILLQSPRKHHQSYAGVLELMKGKLQIAV